MYDETTAGSRLLAIRALLSVVTNKTNGNVRWSEMNILNKRAVTVPQETPAFISYGEKIYEL